jgi:hypothetical protein
MVKAITWWMHSAVNALQFNLPLELKLMHTPQGIAALYCNHRVLSLVVYSWSGHLKHRVVYAFQLAEILAQSVNLVSDVELMAVTLQCVSITIEQQAWRVSLVKP